jgi:hypothetical protein
MHSVTSWNQRVPPQLTIPSEFFSSPSVSRSFHSSASVEMEVTIQYPCAALSHHKILLIVEYLGSVLGPDNCGLEFGYDILPEALNLENMNDFHIFTGESYLYLIS